MIERNGQKRKKDCSDEFMWLELKLKSNKE